jgi:hypothetical protein
MMRWMVERPDAVFLGEVGQGHLAVGVAASDGAGG